MHISGEEKEFLAKGNRDMLKIACSESECSMKFLNERLMKRHSSTQHKRLAPFPPKIRERQPTYCNLCYVHFHRPSDLKNHQSKVHTSPKEIATFTQDEIKHSMLKMKCTMCEKKFFSKNALKYHRKQAHKVELKRDLESDINCEFCNRLFKWKNRSSLKAHIKTIHKVKDYDITEHTVESPQTNAAENFMDILNSL